MVEITIQDENHFYEMVGTIAKKLVAGEKVFINNFESTWAKFDVTDLTISTEKSGSSITYYDNENGYQGLQLKYESFTKVWYY